MLGRPSSATFRYMVAHQLIKNCTATVSDIDRASSIFGPDIGSLKGKTVRNTPVPVVVLPPLAVPKAIFEHHKHIVLSADIFYLDNILFFVTISRNIQLKTVEHISNKIHDLIFKYFKRVIQTYRKRGFIVTTVLTDHEFQPLTARLRPYRVG